MSGFPPYTGDSQKDLVSIGEFLMSNGYSRAAAAGIAGTIAGESVPPGNPESVGSGGGGLIGWTPISSARPKPIITGNKQRDWQNQLTDLLAYAHANGPEGQLKAETDPQRAAQLWSASFERPAVRFSDIRPGTVTSVYNSLANYSPNQGWTQPGGGTSNTPSGGGGLFSWPSEITGFFGDGAKFIHGLLWILTPSNWVRIGAFFAGIILLAVAIYALISVGEGGPVLPKVVPIPV